MKPTRNLLATASIFGCLLGQASGDVYMGFSTGAQYTQETNWKVNFDGGDLSVLLRDGNFVYTGCLGAPSTSIIAPNVFCPLGTTGFVAEGDFDNDGVRDDLSFWSVVEVIPAYIIEPYRPELVTLAAAPASDLPRPLTGFTDQGVLVFYDVLTANVQQYDITLYEFNRVYDEGPSGLAQMKDELVNGSYIFTFPLLDYADDDPPVSISVTYVDIPEGLDPTERYPENDFRFILGNSELGTTGRWDGDGKVLMDPYLTNKIGWTGNSVTNVYSGVDEVRLSIISTEDEGDDPDDATVLFPPSQTPLLLTDVYEDEYTLAPFFFEVGDEGIFVFRLDRALGSTTVALDTSVRLFRFPIRFVSSYEGFKLTAFPVGTSTALRDPEVDYDGDGQSNVTEFALAREGDDDDEDQGTDPTDPTDFHPDPVASSNLDGTVSFSLSKRLDVVANFAFAVSKNDGEFEVIGSDHEEWEITTDNDNALTITTREPATASDYTAKYAISAVTL